MLAPWELYRSANCSRLLMDRRDAYPTLPVPYGLVDGRDAGTNILKILRVLCASVVKVPLRALLPTPCPPSLLVHDGNDRRGPESYSPLVPHKSELHPPAAEKVARLECMGIAESAAGYPDAARRPVGP